MIIWGSKGVTKVAGSGEFHCPSCGTTKPYAHKLLKRYFTLYFIPLFPTDTITEYVECEACAGTYKSEVLSFNPEDHQRRLSEELGEHIKRVMILCTLEGGTIARDVKRRIQQQYQQAAGKTLSDYELEQEIVLARHANVSPATYAQRFAGGLTAIGKENVFRAAALAVGADGNATPEEMKRLSELASALDITPAHSKGILSDLENAGA
jgi:zinc-ribbon family